MRAVRLLVAFVVTGVVAGVLASGLGLPVVAATGAAVDTAVASLAALPLGTTGADLPQTSVMLGSDGAPIAYFYDENRVQVPLSQVAATVPSALVAVEDDRFFEHGAVDPKGLLRAAVTDLTGGGTQGASTLTQQYVKNLQVERALLAHDPAAAQAATARTAARKLQELRLAITVEHTLTKQQILERYLNIVYFGRQAYGIEAAARRYFAMPAARLTLPQAALLAGLVQDPSAYDPISHPQAARERRDVVLADMLAQGRVTSAEYASARAAPVTVTGSAVPNGCAATGPDGFFCEYVVRSLLTSPDYAALGTTADERQARLQAGGLVIRTTLDPTAQSSAVRAVDEHLPATDRSGLAAASVTVEPGTGAVVAMAQDRTYSATPGQGRTSVDYSTDLTLGGSRGFQTGSSFKPFTLATWLAAGHSLYDTVDATPRSFAPSDFTACGQPLRGSTDYTPANSEGNETGPMSVLRATADSVNVAYVQMEQQLDLCDVARTASSLGVHLAAPQSECAGTAGTGTPSTDLPTCLPSLTLGVKEIAPLTMAAAYAGFAADGVWCAPLPVRSIVRSGTPDVPAATLATYAPQCRQAIDPQVAAGVTTALTHVLTDGTAAAVGPLEGWDSAGKTGTTDGPFDTWFVGYTAQRSTAVWVGDPGRVVDGTFQRRRLTDIEVAGHSYPTVFGASIAAPIWKATMTAAMRDLPSRPLSTLAPTDQLPATGSGGFGTADGAGGPGAGGPGPGGGAGTG